MSDALSVIHSRKSVRSFTGQSVSKDALDKIIRAGMAAPTAVNKQPWGFVVVADRKTLDTLASGLPYAVLSDERKRREYDSYRRSYGFFARDKFRQTYTDQDIFKDSDINQVFAELSRAFGFNRPEDIFSRSTFYGNQFRTFQFKGPGFTGKGFFFFSPMSKTYQDMLRASRYQTSNAPAYRPSLFSRIFLKGMQAFQNHMAEKYGLELPERGRDIEDEITIPSEVASDGGKVRYHYDKPDNHRDLMIKIPPGIKEGRKIKLKGMGKDGKHGGESGDLYLKVKVHIPLLKKIKEFFRT